VTTSAELKLPADTVQQNYVKPSVAL